MSFYDRFTLLCDQKGIKPSRAAEDCGINRSNVTMWKNNGSTPRGIALNKIAEYFCVSTDYLLGKEEQKTPTKNGERDGSEIMFALSRGGEQEITDEMFDEVKRFAAYVAQRKKQDDKA